MQAGLRPGDPGFGVEDPAQHGLLTFADGRTERIATEPGRYLDYYDGVAAAILDGAPAARRRGRRPRRPRDHRSRPAKRARGPPHHRLR